MGHFTSRFGITAPHGSSSGVERVAIAVDDIFPRISGYSTIVTKRISSLSVRDIEQILTLEEGLQVVEMRDEGEQMDPTFAFFVGSNFALSDQRRPTSCSRRSPARKSRLDESRGQNQSKPEMQRPTNKGST